MQTVVYADVLFLINFGMDYISLWLAFLIVHRKTCVSRLLISSVIGALFGVIDVLYLSNDLISLILGLTVSAIMIVISVPGKMSLLKYVEYTVILWGVGALIGGLVTLICSFGNNRLTVTSQYSSSFLILAVAVTVASVIVKAFSTVPKAKSCRVCISSFGETVEVECLVDTGNLVKESISGLPVIFVSKACYKHSDSSDIDYLCGGIENIERLSPDAKRRVRVAAVNGELGMSLKLAYVPDEVVIVRGKTRTKVKAVIVIEEKTGYEGLDAVVPAVLM